MSVGSETVKFGNEQVDVSNFHNEEIMKLSYQDYKLLLSQNFRRGLGGCLNLGGDLCPIVFAPVLFVKILK